ncbi:PREDICTED: uncharacterized protein LOC106810623 [Priapulus caudatus]|uniref:Uncharacterized protein LOC106810623 n=1 Tax=Priapulus caudatus TaxID=37621 RepID=A0ABM1EBG2_PRICU|nr:PREDICTED: uncharacterized protein LOC106810623 [Priapulus caudatus]
MWLPSVSTLCMTSGTDPPSTPSVVKMFTNSVTIRWKPAVVYGSNRVEAQLVRCCEVKQMEEDMAPSLARHISVPVDVSKTVVGDLQTGTVYKMLIETIVSVKTDLKESAESRRTVHISSGALLLRTPAPSEPPTLLVTGYTTSTVSLCWERPLLFTPIEAFNDKDNAGPKYLRRRLIGYRLEVNGQPYTRLGPAMQHCNLTKCKQGKRYSMALVAITCTEQVRKYRRKKSKLSSSSSDSRESSLMPQDDYGNDEAFSELVNLVLPSEHADPVSNIRASFKQGRVPCSGHILLEWSPQRVVGLVNYRVFWHTLDNPSDMQIVSIPKDDAGCSIPILAERCVYEVSLQAVFQTGENVKLPGVQVVIPGAPGAPEIWLRRLEDDQFTVEWGEPRLYGVAIANYQLYINDRKAGAPLSLLHHKAVIPSRHERVYKVTIVALTSDPSFTASPHSKALHVETYRADSTAGSQQPAPLSHDVGLKVATFTDTTISLDWSVPTLVTPDIACYRLQWSNNSEPARARSGLRARRQVTSWRTATLAHLLQSKLLLISHKDRGASAKSRAAETCSVEPSPDTPIPEPSRVQLQDTSAYTSGRTSSVRVGTHHELPVCSSTESWRSNLTSQQTRHTFTSGASVSRLRVPVSQPSEPLVVTWPGAEAPSLYHMATSDSDSIRVRWSDPVIMGGIRVAHFKVLCVEETAAHLNPRVYCVGPLHPDTREAEFLNLQESRLPHNVYLEMQVHGSPETVTSRPIRVDSATPNSPIISVTVVGLEERRKMEKVVSRLINKRDRLIRRLYVSNVKEAAAESAGERTPRYPSLSPTQRNCSRQPCHLIVHLKWICPQPSKHIVVIGYKVFLDGKQYGSTLPRSMTNIKLRLDLDQVSHRISMTAVVERPQVAESSESSCIELLTKPFQPFSFFCFHGVHRQGAK